MEFGQSNKLFRPLPVVEPNSEQQLMVTVNGEVEENDIFTGDETEAQLIGREEHWLIRQELPLLKDIFYHRAVLRGWDDILLLPQSTLHLY